jgi:hypothetical protein
VKDFFQYRDSLTERVIKVGSKLFVNFEKGKSQGVTSLTFEWGASNNRDYDGWKNSDCEKSIKQVFKKIEPIIEKEFEKGVVYVIIKGGPKPGDESGDWFGKKGWERCEEFLNDIDPDDFEFDGWVSNSSVNKYSAYIGE